MAAAPAKKEIKCLKDELNSFGCNDSIYLHVWYWHFYARRCRLRRRRILKITFFRNHWPEYAHRPQITTTSSTHCEEGNSMHEGFQFFDIVRLWGQLFQLYINTKEVYFLRCMHCITRPFFSEFLLLA